jgi:hypothetical protein
VRAVITTDAPSAANRSVSAAPIPRLAPVTIARRPSSAPMRDVNQTGQTRSSESMLIAFPRRILYATSGSNSATIFSTYSLLSGHVVSECG